MRHPYITAPIPYITCAVLVVALCSSSAVSDTSYAYSTYSPGVQENTNFKSVWERMDYPLATGKVQRPWAWGPKPFAAITEPLAESPGGMREVQYYDKGRMEINNPGADPRSPWYVTNGLLVYEMLSGRVQVGYSRFEQHDPSSQVIAGDVPPPGDRRGFGPPTFATFAKKATFWGDRNKAADRTGDAVRENMDVDGSIILNPNTGAGHCSLFAHYEPVTAHNIPDSFWSYMNQRGLVYKNGQYTQDKLFDWVQLLGYPISEPYYVTLYVKGGYARDIMIQAFQRRLLTDWGCDPRGSGVAMGNSGLSYYNWRYGEITAARPSASEASRALPFRPTYIPPDPSPGEIYLDLSLVSAIHEISYQVATTPEEWGTLFKRHRPTWGAPYDVDFTNEFVAAAFGGDRANSTNKVLVKTVAIADSDIRVTVDLDVPNVSWGNEINQPNDMVAVSKVTLSPGPYRAIFLDTVGKELSTIDIVLP